MGLWSGQDLASTTGVQVECQWVWWKFGVLNTLQTPKIHPKISSSNCSTLLNTLPDSPFPFTGLGTGTSRTLFMLCWEYKSFFFFLFLSIYPSLFLYFILALLYSLFVNYGFFDGGRTLTLLAQTDSDLQLCECNQTIENQKTKLNQEEQTGK